MAAPKESVKHLARMGKVVCVQQRTGTFCGCHDMAFLGKHFPKRSSRSVVRDVQGPMNHRQDKLAHYPLRS